MRIKIKRKELDKALKTLEVICKKNTYPVLDKVKFETDRFLCASVSGTNLKLSAQLKFPNHSVILESGSCLVDFSKLQTVVKKTKSEVIEIRLLNPEHVEIKSGSFTTKIQTEDVEKLPPIPDVNASCRNFHVRANEFAKDVAKCAACTTTEKTRYNMDHISWQINEGNHYRMAGTDGKRMLFVDGLTSDKKGEGFENIFLSQKFVKLLKKFSSAYNMDTTLTVYQNQHGSLTHFVCDYGIIIQSGEEIMFPPIQQILDKIPAPDTKCTIGKKAYKDKIELIKTFCDPKNKSIVFRLLDKEIDLYTWDDEENQTHDILETSENSGNTSFRVNPDYVSDFHKFVDLETFTLQTHSENKEVVFASENFKMVVLKIRKDLSVEYEGVANTDY